MFQIQKEEIFQAPTSSIDKKNWPVLSLIHSKTQLVSIQSRCKIIRTTNCQIDSTYFYFLYKSNITEY